MLDGNQNQVPLSIRVDEEVKRGLKNVARTKGMDMSKLARIILTNYIRPNTYKL